MSLTLSKGAFKTRNGGTAIVGKVGSYGNMHFVARGAIESPNDGALYIHHWTIDGQSLHPDPMIARQWDIVEEAA